MFPDTADTCLVILKAIDRKAFAVHFDHADIPLMIEHLPAEADYTEAAANIPRTASELGISL